MSINQEEELLRRLQSQFGDLNVGDMIGVEGSSNVADDSSESSIEEPSPEELRVWQEAQYAKGKLKLETKQLIAESTGNVHKSSLQRESWIKVKATAELDLPSTFFPNSATDGDLQLVGDNNTHPLLQQLVEGDPEVLGTKWTALFSSEGGDGLSFHKLLDKIRYYDGPTIMLISGIPSASKSLGNNNSDDCRVSLGFYTLDSWEESPEYHGSDDSCFLFALDYQSNTVKFVRPKSRSQQQHTSPNTGTRKYMYCNSSLQQQTKKGANNNCGIRIGGNVSQPRLYISESLEECRALEYDKLFEDGDLLLGKGKQSLNYFDIDCIEVFGVGGEEWINDALEKRSKAKQIHNASLEQARKVDKKQFLEHFKNDIAACDTNLFGHTAFIEERCDV